MNNKKLITNNNNYTNKNTLIMDENSDNINLLDILNSLLLKIHIDDIAKNLNVAIGTVKRWIELKNIPKSYTFDLMKLANIKINYSIYSFKDKDQFYTPSSTAEYCYKKFLSIINDLGDSEKNYTFIEPSAGNGVFLKLLPKSKRLGFDIEPRFNEIKEQDYLNWLPNEKTNKIIVIGNPPFGLRGQLALKFINHSSLFADYVCFILPQLFESDGKGVPRKRVNNLNLIHSEKLDSKFEYPDNKEIKVQCIFQVWSKLHTNEKYIINNKKNDLIKIYSLSDGGTSSTTRNKNMFSKCDIYLPSTCFGKENMKYYNSFESLPNKKGYGIVFNKEKESNKEKFKKIIWSEIAFLSTNSAYNIRSSQISELFQ